MKGSWIFRRSIVLGGALCLLFAAKGCSSGSSNNHSGGNGGAGGSAGGAGNSAAGAGGGDSGGTCSNVDACGGDVVGTWTVKSSCIKVSGLLDMALVGADCPTAPVSGSREVKGTITFKSNRSYEDNTTTTGEEKLTLGRECLVISKAPVTCDGAANLLTQVLGYSQLTCTTNASGGCDCSASINQKGGLGVLSMSPAVSGDYTTSNKVVAIMGDVDEVKYPSCVSGNTLTMSPEGTSATLTGKIVLEKEGSGGAAGAAGNAAGAGGGGAAGQGGAAGSGGTATGGMKTGGSGGSSSGGAGGTAGASGAGGMSVQGPCDIYAANGTPCVAAHSVVRALFGSYNGKLYQVRRSDNTTKDILTSGPGGLVDTGPEDTFCAGSTCVLTAIYDQSGKGNDLWYQGSEQVPASKSSSAPKATVDPVTVGGRKVYSVFIRPGNCFWHNGSKSGMALDAEPEGMYMVTSSRNTNSGCCFDYGNSETTRSADVGGAMDAINISTTTAWGSGAGSGPWIMADLEWGLFAQGDNKKNPNDPTQTAPFVTAVFKNNGTTEMSIKGGDATTGPLTTYYKGKVPWNPMKKQGAIILGCGGDCCKPDGGANASSGIFFEGAIVTGYPTDAAETAIQSNIVAAGYGK